MLVNIENTNEVNVKKLMEFARENQMNVSFIDDQQNNHWLPGRPFTEAELIQLIEKSRNSGIVSMKDAHSIIRENKNAN